MRILLLKNFYEVFIMKQRILVIEDDNMIRKLIKINLENNNYDVVEAADGMEAKNVFLSTHPCLVILDLMLPKVSGEEFLEWVRTEQRNEVSFIILSAKSRVSDKIDRKSTRLNSSHVSIS